METKKLPIGVDSFEKLRAESFYYVDKTLLVRDLLSSWGEVNFVYAFASLWEDAEYGHVEILLRSRL